MAESVPDAQTTSQEDSVWVTSSDQTENIHGEERKTFPTFGFDVKTRKTDLALVFGNHRLFVRRVLLEEASPVLERIFEEKLDEKTDQEVAIEDVSCEDFAEFLACTLCIQRRERRKITKENVYRMLEIANKYEVTDLKERSKDCLLNILDEEKGEPMTILRLLKVATDFDLAILKSTCFEKADERSLICLQEENATISLPLSVRYELVEKFLPGLISKSFFLDCLKTAVSSEHAAKIDEFQNAKGFHFKFYLKNGESFKEEIRLWNVRWKACVRVPLKVIQFHTGQFTLDGYNLNKDSATPIKSNIAMAVRIRNNIPKKKERFGFETFTFVENFKHVEWWFWGHLGMTEEDYQDQSLGFRWDEKFSLDAYLLINKPE